MTILRFKGTVTPERKLSIELPADIPLGEVTIQIEYETPFFDEPTSTWTDEELDEMMKPNPMTGAEVVAAGLTGGWEHKGITDSVAWVEEQRKNYQTRLIP